MILSYNNCNGRDKKNEKYLLHNFNYILMIKIILIIVKKKK
jgi:hypothetical protein